MVVTQHARARSIHRSYSCTTTHQETEHVIVNIGYHILMLGLALCETHTRIYAFTHMSNTQFRQEVEAIAIRLEQQNSDMVNRIAAVANTPVSLMNTFTFTHV